MKIIRLIAAAAFTAIAIAPQTALAGELTFGQFLAAKARETKAIYSMTWPGDLVRHAGGAYVPINTLVSKDNASEYLDWGLGLEDPEGSDKPRLIVPVMTNLVDLSRKIFGFRWAKNHIKTTALPPIWIGAIWYPPAQLSKDGLKKYVLLHNVGIGISARLSSLWPQEKAEATP